MARSLQFSSPRRAAHPCLEPMGRGGGRGSGTTLRGSQSAERPSCRFKLQPVPFSGRAALWPCRVLVYGGVSWGGGDTCVPCWCRGTDLSPPHHPYALRLPHPCLAPQPVPLHLSHWSALGLGPSGLGLGRRTPPGGRGHLPFGSPTLSPHKDPSVPRPSAPSLLWLCPCFPASGWLAQVWGVQPPASAHPGGRPAPHSPHPSRAVQAPVGVGVHTL